jgi:hypothetical protein
MGLKIKANTFAMQRYLEVFSDGVKFVESAGIGGKRNIRYHEIDHVVLGDDGTLSIQVGMEVFSLPINREKPDHLQALNALLQGVEQRGARPPAAAPTSQLRM